MVTLITMHVLPINANRNMMLFGVMETTIVIMMWETTGIIVLKTLPVWMVNVYLSNIVLLMNVEMVVDSMKDVKSNVMLQEDVTTGLRLLARIIVLMELRIAMRQPLILEEVVSYQSTAIPARADIILIVN